MAINVTKPSVNLREKLNELETNKGLKGNEILQAETAQEVRSLIGAGRKNLIINGGFDVWQRGTSFSGLTSYTYQVDRFQCANSTACSRSADVPTGEGFLYSAKYTAIANDNFIRGMLEDTHRLLGSNTFTFSFWVKGSVAATGNIDVGDQQGQNFSITTSWTRVTKSFTAISTTAHGGTANDYFDIVANTAGDMYITGVQLELGSVATDFEHRSYGEELALCQRYYYKIDGGGYTWIAEVQRHNSTGFRSVISLPVAIRDKPTISYSNLAYWYNNGSINNGTSSISLGYTSSSATDITQLNIEYVPTSMSLTNNSNLSAMLSFTSAGGYLAFDAEL